MELFWALLPLYIVGNFHCIGMCGPLVALIGRHRYRAAYFWGRTLSFALAGGIAGEVGALFAIWLKPYHVASILSLLIGGLIFIFAIWSAFGLSVPGSQKIGDLIGRATRPLAGLMLQDRIWPTFLFGLSTVLLPCGQTLVVFSACAIAGSGLVGFLNGFAFAVLTSPSLFAAMYAFRSFDFARRSYRLLFAFSACFAGGILFCRGLAELEVIPHLAISFGPMIHLALF